MTPETKSTMGSFAPALMSALGVFGSISDNNARNDALMANMGNQARSLEYAQGVQAQQLADIDTVLGDQLSASGLEMLKTESRLKAASAETGGSGASNQEVIQSAKVNELHRNSAIVRQATQAKGSKAQEMIASRLNFENSLESLISGQQSAMSAGLGTLSSALGGLNMGLNMAGDAGVEKFFNTNTTG